MTTGHGRRRRPGLRGMLGMRRWRVVVTAAVTAPLLAIGGTLGLWLTTGRLPVAGGAVWFKVTKLGEAHFSDPPGGPVFILVAGNDARAEVGGARADALHVIGVNPGLGRATILDIPRDTGAEIPGHGTDKINTAFAYGGLELQATAVGQMVGIDISYAITTDFAGFIAMVDEIGGIDVDVPMPMSDRATGAYFEPGPRHLNGEQALAFSRNRHDFPTGDLQRSANQGHLILSTLATLRARGTAGAGTLHAVSVLARHTDTKGLGLGDLYRLGRLGLSIDPAQVRNEVIPVGSGHGTRLALLPSAAGLFADFRDDAVLQSH